MLIVLKKLIILLGIFVISIGLFVCLNNIIIFFVINFFVYLGYEYYKVVVVDICEEILRVDVLL